MGITLIETRTWEKMNERFADFIGRLNKELGTNEQTNEWLDNGDVCGLLNISKRTLQEYRDKGLLPHIKLDGKILYRASDIERLLESFYSG